MHIISSSTRQTAPLPQTSSSRAMDILADVPKSVRVWSFDGGGKNILAQLIVVDKIMRLIQWRRRLNQTPLPCEYADFLIGTGLGGVAAIMIGRLRLSASEAYEDIVRLGQCVFMKRNESSKSQMFSLDTLRSATRLILERRGYKPHAKMIEDSSLTRKCHVIVLASSNVDTAGYKSLRTYPAPASIDCTIEDAIAATMAAPAWFEPAIVNSGLERQTLIGASIGHSNPTWEGLLEAKQAFGVDARVNSVISMGSGRMSPPTTTASIDDRTKWIEQVFNDCEQIARRLSGYFSNVPAYTRFMMEGVLEGTNISDWEDRATELVKSQTTSYLDRVDIVELLGRTVENLLSEVGSISLGQLTQATVPKVGMRDVPRLTPYYVPRPDIHKDIQRCLGEEDSGSQRILVMHGMAGSGKTQLASFFAHTYRRRYKHVFFINSGNVTSIKADLQSAIRSLGGSHSQDTCEDAIRYLQSTESGLFLVIFDNCDDPNLPLVDFIPSCDHGHIIITTRNPDLAFLAPTSHLSITKMNEEKALSVLFLASQSPKLERHAENKDAGAICKLVGYLPLALVQVGCYCHSSKISFSLYLDRFKEHRRRLMGMRPGWQLDQYPHSTYTSISLSYSLLDETEKSLFHLLAFFHPSSIPVDIFRVSALHQFTIDEDSEFIPRDEHHDQRWKNLKLLFTEDDLWSQTRVDELLMRLQSLSLLSLGSDDNSLFITIHPLVQSFAQDILAKEDFTRFHYMAALTLSGCIYDETPDILRHLLLHILEVESYKIPLHLNEVATFAYFFFIRVFDKEALERWKVVESGCEKQFGPDHQSTLLAAAETASCLRELGDHRSAETILRRIIPIQERTLGVDHRNTLSSYNRLGTTLRAQEKYQDAEAIMRKRLEVIERKHGRFHKQTALALSPLAVNLYHLGRHSEAEDIVRECINTLKTTVSEENMMVLTAIGNLAEVLVKLDKWDEAEKILRRLVQTRAKIFGMEDINTLTPVGTLSRCIRHRGELKEAEMLPRWRLDLLSKRFADDHKWVIGARKDLDETLEMLNKVVEGPVTSDSGERVIKLEKARLLYLKLSCLVALVSVLIFYLA